MKRFYVVLRYGILRCIALLVVMYLVTAFDSVLAFAQQEHDHHAVQGETFSKGIPLKLDRSTEQVAEKMAGRLSEVTKKPELLTAREYRELGREIQQLLNELIAGCRMEGAAHDELHRWLEKFIPGVKQLSEVDTALSGKSQVSDLSMMLRQLDERFLMSAEGG